MSRRLLIYCAARNTNRKCPFGSLPGARRASIGREFGYLEVGRFGPGGGSSFLELGLADQVVSAGALDSEVATRVVEQRHRLLADSTGRVHTGDVQVVIARRVNVDDRALEAGDGLYQNR